MPISPIFRRPKSAAPISASSAWPSALASSWGRRWAALSRNSATGCRSCSPPGWRCANVVYGLFVVPESLALENRRAFDWRRANPVGALLRLKIGASARAGAGGDGAAVDAGLSGALRDLVLLSASNAFDWTPGQVGWSLAAVGLVGRDRAGRAVAQADPALWPAQHHHRRRAVVDCRLSRSTPSPPRAG